MHIYQHCPVPFKQIFYLAQCMRGSRGGGGGGEGLDPTPTTFQGMGFEIVKLCRLTHPVLKLPPAPRKFAGSAHAVRVCICICACIKFLFQGEICRSIAGFGLVGILPCVNFCIFPLCQRECLGCNNRFRMDYLLHIPVLPCGLGANLRYMGYF